MPPGFLNRDKVFLSAAAVDSEPKAPSGGIVSLEPDFRHAVRFPAAPSVIDDGRIDNIFSRLVGGSLAELKNPTARDAMVAPLVSTITAPADTELCFFRVNLPAEYEPLPAQIEQLLGSLINSLEFVSFEIIGNETELYFQFAAPDRQNDVLARQLRVHLPEFDIRSSEDALAGIDVKASSNATLVQFGLADHWFLPIPTGQELKADPMIPLVGAFDGLGSEEIVCVQMMFGRTRHPWQQSVRTALFDVHGKAKYSNFGDQVKAIRQKLSDPLAAVSVRLWINGTNQSASNGVAREIMPYFKQFGSVSGNALVPLSTADPIQPDTAENVVARTSYRSGILLSLPELTSLVRFPSDAVRSKKLRRHARKEKRAPEVTSRGSIVLGRNPYQNEDHEVRLSREQRTRHMHVIGSSGSGKTTLLLALIKSDMENGDGVCVVDPHGDLIDAVMTNVPDERLRDVVLFDPSDAEMPIALNLIQANSPLEKTILSSDLVATFRRMATSWGDVMDSVLANAVLAFLESTRGGTLFDLRRFLVEKNFREDFLKTVTDDAVKYFWEHEFQLIAGKPQASILIRLDTFLRQSLIRNVVCQKENKLNFRALMDQKKIILVKLSQGLIGEENAYLLGTMILSRIYQAALSRQDSQERPHCWLSVDEFHHLVTPSLESVLSGARKYNLGVTLGHQQFKQIQTRSQDVASSVLSNCYTRVCFRLGDADAEKFAGGFSSFDAKALQNLGVGEAIARVERADYDFNLRVEAVPRVDPEVAKRRMEAIRAFSRKTYGRPRSEVEEEFRVIRSDSGSAARRNKAVEPTMRVTEESFGGEPTGTRKQGQVQTGGKGTGEHGYLQTIVKRIGEKNGFRASIEQSVLGGVGRVDVALDNGKVLVAVEVAVTNSVEYEVSNVQKCLSSGYDHVVVLSVDESHLRQIELAAATTIADVQIKKVAFLKPDDLDLYLKRLCRDELDLSTDPKIKGYRIIASFAVETPGAARLLKETIAEILGTEDSK